MPTSLRPDQVELLVEHTRRALVGALGATTVEVWLGKDGAARHHVESLADAVVRSLLPVLDTADAAARVHDLHRRGTLAPALELDATDW